MKRDQLPRPASAPAAAATATASATAAAKADSATSATASTRTAASVGSASRQNTDAPGHASGHGPSLAPDRGPKAPAYAPSGTHLLADLSGIAAEKLSNCATLETLLRDAAAAANARVLFSHFHAFGAGQGVTGVVLLAESHITLHTWPECGFAAVDIFMCGSAQPELALTLIEDALQPTSTSIQSIHRSATGVQP